MKGSYAALAAYPVNPSRSFVVCAILFVLYGAVASTALMSAGSKNNCERCEICPQLNVPFELIVAPV
jgi:hypothetical protein